LLGGRSRLSSLPTSVLMANISRPPVEALAEITAAAEAGTSAGRMAPEAAVGIRHEAAVAMRPAVGEAALPVVVEEGAVREVAAAVERPVVAVAAVEGAERPVVAVAAVEWVGVGEWAEEAEPRVVEEAVAVAAAGTLAAGEDVPATNGLPSSPA